MDYCRTNFAPTNPALAAEMASLLASVDGDADSVYGAKLPMFTRCCPGHIDGPAQPAFCASMNESFAFVSRWSSLGAKVRQ